MQGELSGGVARAWLRRREQIRGFPRASARRLALALASTAGGGGRPPRHAAGDSRRAGGRPCLEEWVMMTDSRGGAGEQGG
ncbi:hypothetical protein SETIT_4G178800v2 [Setaria italica]|uniref:Uncharacterized protein n=1 Tax=Setaria italica TaxID=4555 RepID=A0A368QVM2_SETIT|nr:hypothetical protein SETIT_4G178800v2 [Setaria italica]